LIPFCRRQLADKSCAGSNLGFIMEPQTKPRSVLKNQVGQLSSPSFVHRWPVFYGWIVMAAGSLGLVMTSPGQTYAIQKPVKQPVRIEPA
jgi:hypothetical protein